MPSSATSLPGAPGDGLAKLGVLIPGLALLDIQVLPLPGQPRHFRLEPVMLGPHFSPSTYCGAGSARIRRVALSPSAQVV